MSQKNISNTIIFTVVLSLLVSVLSGCKKTEISNQNTGQADPERHNISVSMYERGNIPEGAGSSTNNMWTQWVQLNAGINVKYISIPRGESVQKFNVLLASKEAPDLIQEYDTQFINKLYNQKQIMPLDDLIQQNSKEYKEVLTKFPMLKKLATQADGKMYAIGRVLGYIPFTFLFIREDWLQSLNLKVPQTTEELLEVTKEFALKDPDRNGKNDTYGINMSGFAPDIFNSMFQNLKWMVEDGQVVRDWERAQAALQFKKQLFDSGAIDREYLTDRNGKKAELDFVKGKTGVYAYAGNAKQIYDLYALLRKNNPQSKIIPIALPKGPFGQFSAQFNPPFQISAVINTQAKDPVGVIKYIDFMSRETTEKTFKFGLEGVHYRMENGVPVTLDKAKYDKEVSWIGDFRSIGPQYHVTEYEKYKQDLDLTQAFDKEVYDLLNRAFPLYMSSDRPYAGLTLDRYMPSLPNDIDFINTYAEKSVQDIWNRAILGGNQYTAEQAVKDAKALWEKGNGRKVENWYREWYKQNKDNWVFTKDLYQIDIK